MSEKKTLLFDIERFIADHGGATKVAKITGKGRTTPYKWIDQGFLNTKILGQLKAENPHIIIDKYFK